MAFHHFNFERRNVPKSARLARHFGKLAVLFFKNWGFFIKCSKVFKLSKAKNKRNAVNSTFLSLFTNAADRNRTGTGITTHGILSPGRLPVPPLRQISSCLPFSHILMRETTQKRLELSTSAVTGRRSNQLSHWASL